MIFSVKNGVRRQASGVRERGRKGEWVKGRVGEKGLRD
jgi:hypothetical protein